MLNEILNRGVGMNLGWFGKKLNIRPGIFVLFFCEGERLRIFINDT